MNLQCVSCKERIKERQSFTQLYGGGFIHEECFLNTGIGVTHDHHLPPHLAREVNMQPVGEPLTADDVLDIRHEFQTQKTKN